MADYPKTPNNQFLPEPPPPYAPRTPPPQRVNIPPAAMYVPPTTSQYPPHAHEGLQGTLSSVGKELHGVIKGITKAGVKALNKVLDHPTLSMIRHGNVIQLISRTTGRSVQILQSSNNHLIIDGLGGDGHHFLNAHFTIIQESDSYFLLHNNFNYLAIKDGVAQIYAAGPCNMATPSCRFKVREVVLQNQFVLFESVAERGKYLAVLCDGQMKSALATSPSDQDTHFAVRLIYSPYDKVSIK